MAQDANPGYPAPDSSPPQGTITVYERSERYLMTRVLQAVIKPFRPALVKVGKIATEDSTRINAPKAALKRCDVEERQVEGLWVYDLTAKSTGKSTGKAREGYRRRIIYFSGGGWQMPPSNQHWSFCAEMVSRMPDTKITIVSSPLAPKDPVSVAFPQIEKTYKELLKYAARAGEAVVVAGDSSGGNIALAVATWTLKTSQEQDLVPPTAILAICPTTDLRHEHPDIKTADKVDPVLTFSCINSTARTWCPEPTGSSQPGDDTRAGHNEKGMRLDWSFEDPRVSPIQADLGVLARNYVKVHGITASHDVLGPEAVAFRDKCNKEGIRGEWLAWDGQMHCFPLAFKYGLKESKEAMDFVVDVLQRS
ncbi:Abhydrolase-3 domain-containing protein [Fusarium sp. Ph1]|nr:Abhydrolase-3 domain-containing protein [Fusarium sp. Ph1]